LDTDLKREQKTEKKPSINIEEMAENLNSEEQILERE
jgi:hypothetical protein